MESLTETQLNYSVGSDILGSQEVLQTPTHWIWTF